MAVNLDRFKKELHDLQYRGGLLEASMIKEVYGKEKVREALGHPSDEQFEAILKELPSFKTGYECWYSEALAVIRQLLPDRVDAFIRQYEAPRNRKNTDYSSYVIEDYMIGLRVTQGLDVKVDRTAAVPKLQNQTAILGAAAARFDSSLFEIRQLVQADLFDSEIASARGLLKTGFLRAAGAVAGVILEKHLRQVCDDHRLKVTKKNPTINDFNQLLKDNSVIDVPAWRHISMLGDIRNICDHNKAKGAYSRPSHRPD